MASKQEYPGGVEGDAFTQCGAWLLDRAAEAEAGGGRRAEGGRRRAGGGRYPEHNTH